MASGDKFYIADKDTLDGLNGKIGATTDVGGSEITGTSMAKLNAILTAIGKVGEVLDSI